MSDWDRITVIAAVSVAVVSLLSLIIVTFQWRMEKAKNEDRRLDEKVMALIGQNVLTLNQLSSHARDTVSNADRAAAEVEQAAVETRKAYDDATVIQQQLQNDMTTIRQSLDEARELAVSLAELVDEARRDTEKISSDADLADDLTVTLFEQLQMAYVIAERDLSAEEHELKNLERARDFVRDLAFENDDRRAEFQLRQYEDRLSNLTDRIEQRRARLSELRTEMMGIRLRREGPSSDA